MNQLPPEFNLHGEVLARMKRVRSWLFRAAGLLTLAVAAIVVLRTLGYEPQLVLRILGVIAVYGMGSCVYLFLWLRNLREQIRYLERQADPEGDEPESTGSGSHAVHD